MGFFGAGKNKEDKQKNKVIQKAQKYAQKGQIENAVVEWASLLKNKAEDANIYNTIGDLYLKGNLKDKAIEAYRKACKIYTDSGFALKAIAVNKKVLKLDPGDLDSMMSMAQLHKERGMVTNAKESYLAIAEYHIRTGSHDKALEAYQKIVDMDPKNLKVKLSLAELYLKEGMVPEGSRIYGEVIGALLEDARYDDAEKLCKRLEGTLGSPGANLRYMVQIHLAQNRVDEALECAKQLEERGEQDPEIAVYNAEILIRKGHAQEGIAALRKIDRTAVTEFSLLKIFRHLLVAGETDQALDVLNDIAEKYLGSSRFEELFRLYQQVIDHDPNHLNVRQKMVDLLKKMKRDQDVIRQYKEMGRIYASSGHKEEAKNIYEKILCITPEDIEAKALLKEVNREASQGATMEFGERVFSSASEGTAPEENVNAIDDKMEIETSETTDIEQAGVPGSEALQEAVDPSGDGGEEIEVIKENDEDQGNFLTDNITEADVYMKYGHMKKAIVHLEKNLEMAPKHIPTHERLLQIFIEQGNIQEQVNTLIILSKLYLEQGEHNKYEEALNEVLVLDPENEDAKRGLKEGPMALSSSAMDETPKEAESFKFEFDDKEKAEAGPATGDGRQGVDVPLEKAGDTESIDELLDEADFYLQNGMIDEGRVIYEKILALHPDRTDVAGKLKEISGNGEQEATTPDQVSKLFSEVAQEVNDKEVPSFMESAGDDRTSIKTGASGEEPASFMADDFKSFAEALRQEVDGTVSGADHEAGELSGTTNDMLDFSSELRREVEESLASTGQVFGDNDVMEIFNEFREGVQRELGDEDYETHYNLGIAYMEMGLIDEACEEFTIASREPRRLMDCLTMIGLCYTQKGEFRKALAELERGLTVQGRSDEEYNSIRYEIAKASELLGNKERAVQELLNIHENNPGYRDLQAKLKAFGVKADDRAREVIKTQDKKSKVSYL